ncbi:MAG: response regulator [Deltaproteobacteria bacterium]
MAVEDTLEGLRAQIEELAGLLAGGERDRPPAGDVAPGEPALGLGHSVAHLVHRLDQAGELMAMLTDLLEAQAERLESLEARVDELTGVTAVASGLETEDQGAVADALAAVARQQQVANERLASIEARLVAMAPSPEPPAGSETPVQSEPARSDEQAAQTSLARLAEREIEGRDIKPAKSHPTVLVVDDLAEARTLLSIYLSKTGYQVVTASSAEDCLAKLLYHQVDAIVLDAELSGADGGHVLRVIREEDRYTAMRGIPVIIYTAYPDRVGREQAGRWGATEYVVKGGDMLPLMSALIRHTSATGAGARP